jgi:centromere-localized protein 2
MEQACADIDAEIVASEAEFEMMKEDMESTVGGLSDLRYGRFSKPIGSDGELREEVLDGLKRLDETCISRRGSS